jgi:hypothetical protein
MTVYAIALLNILDRERYGTYQQGFMEIFSIAASCWLGMMRRRSRRATGPTLAQFWLNSQAPMHSTPGLTRRNIKLWLSTGTQPRLARSL